MADFERDLLLRLQADNSQLKASLAEAQAQLDLFKKSLAEIAAAQGLVQGATTPVVEAIGEESAQLEFNTGSANQNSAALERAALLRKDIAAATEAALAPEVELGAAQKDAAASSLLESDADTAAATAKLRKAAASIAASGAIEDETAATGSLVTGDERFITALGAVREAQIGLTASITAGNTITFGEYEELKLQALELAGAIAVAKAAASAPSGDISLASKELAAFNANMAIAELQAGGFGGGINRMREGLRLARAELGPAGEAVAYLSRGMHDFLIPLAIGAVGIGLFNELLKTLGERGVNVATIGDLMTKATDALATAMGGASEGVKQMGEGAAKAQEKLEGMTEATRRYETAVGLMNAAGVDGTAVLESLTNEELASADASVLTAFAIGGLFGGLGELSAGAAKARNEIAAFNVELNAARLIDPAKAAEAAVAFQKLSREYQEAAITQKEYIQGVEELRKSLDPLAAEAAKVGRILEEEFGKKGAKTAREELGGLLTVASTIAPRLKEMTDAGMTAAQATAILSGDIEKVAKGAGQYATALAALSPEQQRVVAEVRNMGDGLEKTDKAVEKFQKRIREQQDDLDQINRTIAAGTDKYGNYQLALRASEAAIDSLVAKIEKQRDSQGRLSKQDQEQLETLEKLRAAMGLTADARARLVEGTDKGAKSIAAEIDHLEEERHAYERSSREIELHRLTKIRALDDGERASRKAFVQEIADLNARNAAGELAFGEYQAKYAEAQAKEVDARREAQKKEYEINQQARADTIETQRVFEEKSQLMIDKGLAVGQSFLQQLEIHDRYKESIRGVLAESEKLAKFQDDMAVAVGKTRDALGGNLGLAAAMAAAATSSGDFLTKLSGLPTTLGQVETRLKAITDFVKELEADDASFGPDQDVAGVPLY